MSKLQPSFVPTGTQGHGCTAKQHNLWPCFFFWLFALETAAEKNSPDSSKLPAQRRKEITGKASQSYHCDAVGKLIQRIAIIDSREDRHMPFAAYKASQTAPQIRSCFRKLFLQPCLRPVISRSGTLSVSQLELTEPYFQI